MVASHSLYAQDIPDVLEFNLVGLERGLSQSTVTAFTQDSHGFLWIGTRDGLNRYDGIHLRTFRRDRFQPDISLADNTIYNLIALSNGDLLVAHSMGLSRYHANTNTFTNYLSVVNNEEEISVGEVYALHKGRTGTIWLSSTSGLFSYDELSHSLKLVKHIDFDDFVATALYEQDDVLWLGGYFGLRHYNIESDSLYAHESTAMFDDFIISNILSWNDRIIIATLQDGLFERDANHKISQITEWDLPESIFNIYTDQADNLWMATNRGVIRITPQGHFYLHNHNPDQRNSLPQNSLNTVFVDSGFNLWVGTWHKGAASANLKPVKFQSLLTYTPSENLDDSSIWAIAQIDDEHFWIGRDKGFIEVSTSGQITRTSLQMSAIPSEINNTAVLVMNKDHNGAIWIGTQEYGVYIMYPNGFIRHLMHHSNGENASHQLSDFEIFAIIHGENHTWIGTRFGLNVWDHHAEKVIILDDEGIDDEIILALDFSKDKQFVFAGTATGLKKISTSDYSVQNIPLATAEGVENSEVIFSLHYSNEFWWIGTQNGLLRYDEKLNTTDFFSHSEELSSNFIYQIVDYDDEIWLTTNRGLIRILNSAEPVTSDIQYRLYQIYDGLLSNEFNQGASYKDKHNRLFFGNLGGVNFVNPSLLQDNPFLPPVSILGINVIRGSEQRFYNLLGREEITLHYTDNVISLDFAVLDYTLPFRNRVSWKLDGFDENWNYRYAGEGTSVIYTNLNPGTYSFLVRGSNNDGVWNNEGAILRIIITPPFYRTLWFYSLSGFGLILGLILIVTWRERVLQIKNAELEELVEIRTDELAQRELLFRLISENASELISMIDDKGTFLYVSPSYQEVLGYTYEDLVGTDVFALAHEEDIPHAMHAFADIIHSGKTQSVEIRLRNKRDKFRIFRVNAAAISNSQSTPETKARFVLVASDITTQKQTEVALRNAMYQAEEASRAKSSFLAGMSHELRTPLNAILGFAQILKRSTALPEREKNYVNTMYSSGQHLLTMINDVLDISKIEAGKMTVLPEEFDMGILLRDVYEMFRLQAAERNLMFRISQDITLPGYVYADAGKIKQILINLISNAIKFTDKGHVKVRMEATCDNDESGNQTGWLKFEVEDTGEGIPEHRQRSIFEPFQQYSENYSKGSGLGLAICARLTELMNGKIEVKSEQGKGSVFSFEVPVSYIARTNGFGSGETIKYTGIDYHKEPVALLVDDIEYNLNLLESILVPLGIRCEKAVDGRQALEKLNAFVPDFILMDLRMPNMDGIQATEKILSNEETASIPVLAVTASGFQGKKEELLKKGFSAYIRKPFREEELIREIANVTNIVFLTEDEFVATEHQPEVIRVAQAIEKLEEPLRSLIRDAVELTDLEKIAELHDQFPENPNFIRLFKKAKNREFAFFIKLNELINPN